MHFLIKIICMVNCLLSANLIATCLCKECQCSTGETCGCQTNQSCRCHEKRAACCSPQTLCPID